MEFLNKHDQDDNMVVLSKSAKKSVYLFLDFILLILIVLIILMISGHILFVSVLREPSYHDGEYCAECAATSFAPLLLFIIPAVIIPSIKAIVKLYRVNSEASKDLSDPNIINAKTVSLIKSLTWIIFWINFFLLVTVPVMIILYRKMKAKINDCCNEMPEDAEIPTSEF